MIGRKDVALVGHSFGGRIAVFALMNIRSFSNALS